MSSATVQLHRPTRLGIGLSTLAPATSSAPRALWDKAMLALSSLRQLDFGHWLAAEAEPNTPEQVLAWANRIANTEPGFAADLRAAALRAMVDEEKR